MPKPKSFLKHIEVDVAKRTHSCQHNTLHRIKPGEKRLLFKEDRSIEYFCVSCAVETINNDIKKLEEIKQELQK